MATIGFVNASSCENQDSNKKQSRRKVFFFGVFFDGTKNNMVQKEQAKAYREQNRKKAENASKSSNTKSKKSKDTPTPYEALVVDNNDESFMNGANQINATSATKGYSNVAILHSLYQGMSQDEIKKYNNTDTDVLIYNIYVEGAGADHDQSMYSNLKGKATGKGKAGVASLVCKAVAMVRERLKDVKAADRPKTEVHFDVFGFSRGAACARLFSYLAIRTSKNQRLKCESEFENTLAKQYYKSNETFLHFLDFLNEKKVKRFKNENVTVDFLGLYDTVSSIGGLSTDSYANNVRDYGLNSPTMNNVLNTFHLCAIDEFREHFALTDIGTACHKGDNAEIFIPGCHTDVGGGYTDGDYKFTLHVNDNFMFPEDRIEHPTRFLPINEDSLRKLGWWSDDNEINYNSFLKTISVKRHIESGYSHIPLAMMKIRSEKKLEREIFKEIDQRFKISDNFSQWKDQLLRYSSASGRKWCYPGSSFSSGSYQKLRKFLHFSSNETLVGLTIGNKPYYYDNTICRPVYHGDGNFERTCFHEAYSNHSERELRTAPPGEHGNWNRELNLKPLPNTDYLIGDKLYETDGEGRVIHVKGSIELSEKKSEENRNKTQQSKAVELKMAKNDKKEIYDAGHLIAAMFKGAGEQINYVPMLSSINRSGGKWYEMEKEWKDALDKKTPEKVTVSMRIKYDDSNRPIVLRVTSVIGEKKKNYAFGNI